MNFNYCGSICSDIDLVKSFTDELLSKISEIVSDQNTLFDIRLILNELIINGVFHGNECDKFKCVNIDLNIRGNKLVLEVEDEGQGIEYDLNSYDPKNLKPSGRGLVIVNGLSDELIVENNKVVAIKFI